MGESFRTKVRRWGFNFFPAYRRTGGRLTYLADDLKTIKVEIPLNAKTRNYVGTIFGGSMYGAVDPIYMVMFIQLLGPDYIVWDKAAAIQFKRPGTSTLRAEFSVTDEELDSIRNELEKRDKIDRIYSVDLLDRDNNVCATVEKTIHFRRK
jgi:acyl-coenzyme A thioesterase PaaI-like protein